MNRASCFEKTFKINFSYIRDLYFLYVNNHWIVTTEHVYESEKVPESFDGFRITQISDLHDAVFGNNQEHLVEKVRETEPNVIFITGDVIDSNRYDLEQSLVAVRQLAEIAEIYYVIGNHEVAINQVDAIYEAMRQIGVHVVPNSSVILNHTEGDSISLIGIEDPLNGHETQDMLNEAMANVNEDRLRIF